MANLKNFESKLILRQQQKGGKAFRTVGENLKGAAKAAGRFVAAAAPIAAAAFFGKSIQASAQFQQSIADLAAITGSTGSELRFLTEQSQRFGQASTFSAAQAAEAFKLVASAKPDLLGNAEALSETTRQTLLLAEAAGLELPQSAEIVGQALNQFGAGADQASRFINVLAAGSQKGASEVNETAEALLKSGVAAKSAGVSFEATNAAIQTLAGVGIKGAEAGTALRNVFTRLQTQANDQFNPAIVGTEQALRNLGEANLSVTEKVKLFGERSLAAGETLINNVDQFADYELALTGTDTALEQAAIRVDTLQGDTKSLGSAFEALAIKTGDKLNPVSRQVVQNFTDILNAFADTTEAGNEAAQGFDFLETTLDTLGTAAFAVKQIFVSVGEIIGGIAASLIAVFEGEFSRAGEILDMVFEDVKDNFGEVAEFSNKLEQSNRAAISTTDARIKKEKELNEQAKQTFATQAEVAAKTTEVNNEALTAGEEIAVKKEERERAALERKIEGIRVANLTELELLQEKLLGEQEIIAAGLESNLITETAAKEQLLLLEKTFQEKKAKIKKTGESKIEKFTAMSAKGQTNVVLDQAMKMTQGVASSSKTLFKINKAAALAKAVIALPEHVSSTMAQYPYPLSIAMGALAAAASLAQIQAIRSTSFGGGGGGTGVPSGGGGTPSVSSLPEIVPTGAEGGILPPPPGGTGGGQDLTVNVEGLPPGQLVSTDTMRDMMEQMVDQMGDNVKINFNTGVE